MKREKPKRMKAFAAYNPETMECMAPTISTNYRVTANERDKYYQGCDIFECVVVPGRPLTARERGEKRRG